MAASGDQYYPYSRIYTKSYDITKDIDLVSDSQDSIYTDSNQYDKPFQVSIRPDTSIKTTFFNQESLEQVEFAKFMKNKVLNTEQDIYGEVLSSGSGNQYKRYAVSILLESGKELNLIIYKNFAIAGNVNDWCTMNTPEYLGVGWPQNPLGMFSRLFDPNDGRADNYKEKTVDPAPSFGPQGSNKMAEYLNAITLDTNHKPYIDRYIERGNR